MFTKELQPQQCMEEETVEFLCEISKDTPVTWYKDGRPIAPSNVYTITNEGLIHKLVIAHADLDDEGDYKVVAGPAVSTAPLTVHGKLYVLSQ